MFLLKHQASGKSRVTRMSAKATVFLLLAMSVLGSVSGASAAAEGKCARSSFSYDDTDVTGKITTLRHRAEIQACTDGSKVTSVKVLTNKVEFVGIGVAGSMTPTSTHDNTGAVGYTAVPVVIEGSLVNDTHKWDITVFVRDGNLFVRYSQTGWGS